MEFEEIVRRRRMVRAFAPDPLDPDLVDRLIDQARRAPSAGNTQATEFLVLEGARQTAEYWDTTLPASRRDGFPWPALLHAPAIVVVWVDPAAYVDRYREADKTTTDLGRDLKAWPVPYWWVDGGAAVMTLLHGAVDLGLGALFFGLFDHEEAVRRRFGVPPGKRAVGAVALGHPARDRPASSSHRSRPPLDEVIHRGRWADSAIAIAYRALVGENDPARPYLGRARDLRPSGRSRDGTEPIVVSGPDDLRELREAMEAITGAGTWPFDNRLPAEYDTRLTRTIVLPSQASLLGFVDALQGVVVDRAAAWRTWRTVVESVAAALGPPINLTVDAVVVSGELADQLSD